MLLAYRNFVDAEAAEIDAYDVKPDLCVHLMSTCTATVLNLLDKPRNGTIKRKVTNSGKYMS